MSSPGTGEEGIQETCTVIEPDITKIKIKSGRILD